MSHRPQWRGYPTTPTDQRQPPAAFRSYEAPFARVNDLAVRQREIGLRDGVLSPVADHMVNRMLYPRLPPTLNGSRVYVRGEPTAPYPWA